jgi:prepilin-type N-terminal cleavage/methylation domain-containing protein
MKNKKIAAFSLIELIIVVVVLGIIVGMALVSYNERRKRGEYNTAVAQVRAIVGAEKDYRLTMGSYISTSGTVNTNNLFIIKIFDGYFRNYRVNLGGGTFTILVDSASGASTAIYTFNSEGEFVSCVGSDCI